MEINMDKVQRQLDMEQESIARGIHDYQMKMTEAYQNGTFSDLPSGIAITSQLVEPFVQEIHGFLEDGLFGGNNARVKGILRGIDLYVTAFVTLKVILNNVSGKESVALQSVCQDIGTALLTEVNITAFSKAKYIDPDTGKELSHDAYVKSVIKQKAKQGANKSRTARALKAMMVEKGLEVQEWDNDTKFQVGQKLLQLFTLRTGLVSRHREIVHKKEKIVVIPSQELVNMFDQINSYCELLKPHLLPMVCEPKDWAPGVPGGYLSGERGLRFKFVRTRNKEYIKTLKTVEMPIVYEAVNTLQRTPWKINKEVAEVFMTLWEQGGDYPELKMPPNKELELPIKPWGDLSNEEFEVYKEQHPDIVKNYVIMKRDLINDHIIQRSQRISIHRMKEVVMEFINEPEIFFCYTLDFRGRVYPVQNALHPQGNDLMKAMLTLSHKKPVGEHGYKWLAIAGASAYGVDKVSFADRIKWVQENEDKIIAVAKDPLGTIDFWGAHSWIGEGKRRKKKGEVDSPWKFLYFCMEWSKFRDSDYSPKFETSFTVALDGSNNGVQHLSACTLDPFGAEATNLVQPKDDKPADIYRMVAEVVSERLVEEASKGVPEAIVLNGKITRNIVKRNTMTTAYGVTDRGRVDQILDELRDVREDFESKDAHFFQVCKYLGEMNGQAIASVVTKAVEAMDTLKAWAKTAGETGKGISWVTPAGFPVLQEYKKQQIKRVKSFWGSANVRQDLSMAQDTDKVNVAKGVVSIAPNWVHSNDAAHMMLTIHECNKLGVHHFAMIHDSYGTQVGDTEVLYNTIRKAFVNMYEKDVMEDFRTQLISQLPADLHESVVPCPTKGDFDLTNVLTSKYFFA